MCLLSNPPRTGAGASAPAPVAEVPLVRVSALAMPAGSPPGPGRHRDPTILARPHLARIAGRSLRTRPHAPAAFAVRAVIPRSPAYAHPRRSLPRPSRRPRRPPTRALRSAHHALVPTSRTTPSS
ncbi:hypothetical protein DB32_004667 [Sandaracinus amylolyticus]|uniref:Uncharacterized protein n=1 Tax=Sandaracinus amylolyticus TaxID=927083 RepID=A0A0F6W4U1_9BACT|nr:hypothetical protein DB32_004667 [Sandaracinus amylolyticus]